MPNNSIEHLKDCEARTVMRWPKAKHQGYYEQVLKHRGESGLRDLQERVNEQYRKDMLEL